MSRVSGRSQLWVEIGLGPSVQLGCPVRVVGPGQSGEAEKLVGWQGVVGGSQAVGRLFVAPNRPTYRTRQSKTGWQGIRPNLVNLLMRRRSQEFQSIKRASLYEVTITIYCGFTHSLQMREASIVIRAWGLERSSSFSGKESIFWQRCLG